MVITGNSSIDLSLANVWRSWRAFRAGKKPSRAIYEFEANLEQNLLLLYNDLRQGGRYRHGAYAHKIVSDKKRRDIFVAEVRDRVVHRLLYDYMVSIVDKRLDHDVWSCRKGKGLHGAITRVEELIRKYPSAHIWRSDVVKFFDNVDQKVLKMAVARQGFCKRAVRLCNEVIDSAEQGIPIGNLTSQIFANIYMNNFDRFVRHSIKPLAYIRYGDDFLSFLSNRDLAVKAEVECREFLGNVLSLKLNPVQNHIVKPGHTVRFLGSTFFRDGNSRQNLRSMPKDRVQLASSKALRLSGQMRRVLDFIDPDGDFRDLVDF